MLRIILALLLVSNLALPDDKTITIVGYADADKKCANDQDVLNLKLQVQVSEIGTKLAEHERDDARREVSILPSWAWIAIGGLAATTAWSFWYYNHNR
jgi:hypothetical protein